MTSLQLEMAQGYANALFEMAQDAAILERIHQDLKSMTDVINALPSFNEALIQVNRLSVSEAKVFISPLVGQVHPFIKNTITVMLDSHHIEALPSLYAAFLPLYENIKGLGHVHIKTAVAIDDETKNTIASRLKALLKLNEVRLQHSVMPELLGGLYVEYRGVRLDASLKRKLSGLETHISQV